MRALLAELTKAMDEGRPCVYCSVVETRGSTPQKAGAAMLVFADGSQAGTLGGGCVEAEVKRKALRTLAATGDAKPDLHSFCLDDNYGWDDGLICGGRMDILADPLSAPHAGDYYRRLRELVESGQGCTEAVVISSQPAVAPLGSRYLFDANNRLLDQTGSALAPALVQNQLMDLAKRPKPYLQQGVAYLPVLPRITLLIVGGGHVGQAVAKLAAEVDFDIWVMDDRETYTSPQRFPMARRRLVGDIGQMLQELNGSLTRSTYALIVTRGHSHDEEALYHLVNTAATYVGMIGSKRKIKMIFEDLRARGISSDSLARVRAPLGIAIGSQTVPEIAISIVAELIAARNLAVSGERKGARGEQDPRDSSLASHPSPLT
jgi:xanthine dehydrogenase accessory factor